MSKKKILWLCSWYPDRLQPFNGDFVQRHARAASLYNDIHVIHVTGDNINGETENVENKQGNLTEHIVYFKKARWFSKIINFRRWQKAYQLAIRKYISENGKPDIIHLNVPFRDGLIAVKLKKEYSLPLLITEHWTIYQPQNNVLFENQPSLLKSIIRLIIRKADLLLPVSKDLGDLINKKVAPKDFTVVENVADTNLFFPADRSAASQQMFRFLHVSTMSYQKNIEGLIGSFVNFHESHPNSELVLVGPVPPQVSKLISASPAIKTTGEIAYIKVAEEMKNADALVLFSRYENSPCSIIEALCCGLPVIATRVGGIPELINSHNGILIEVGKNAELESAMAELLNNYSRFDKNRIAADAHSRFSYEMIGKKLDEIYTDQLNNSQKPG